MGVDCGWASLGGFVCAGMHRGVHRRAVGFSGGAAVPSKGVRASVNAGGYAMKKISGSTWIGIILLILALVCLLNSSRIERFGKQTGDRFIDSVAKDRIEKRIKQMKP